MIRIFEDEKALSFGAAELFVRCAQAAIKDKGIFTVALSGGHTPRDTYKLLALSPLRDQVDWKRTEVFWSDERCVPATDLRSNSKMAFETLLNHVPVPPDCIHPIHCDGNSAQGAATYEDLLMKRFGGPSPRFDLIFLGLGENGHTASLFPETAALTAEGHLVSDVRVRGEDFFRVTLTAAAINHATLVAFLVSGASKASVLEEVLQGPKDPFRLPAQLIQPIEGKTLWLLDRNAASRLKGTEQELQG